MKFVVTRTTLMWEERPCKEANLVEAKPTPFWTIEIDSLEYLMNLMLEWESSVVIHPPSEFPAVPEWRNLPRIEIYDDYRE